ncbi:hypothetical protein BDN72DRAFT_900348 [Pluteus cervinus]|uniref:Uncharacterized protein n=1 Tax=Pluteus cervinus TaxID=181527 RepID=A0ACD3AIU9_9AGAR|nr:hypothetical protein BDN72DRAFT_900348 [Pluteus cervinus]
MIPQPSSSSLRVKLFAAIVMDFVDSSPTETKNFSSAWSPPVFRNAQQRDDYLGECWDTFCTINAFYLGCSAEEHSDQWYAMQEGLFQVWLKANPVGEPLCWMPEPYLSICEILDISEEELKMPLQMLVSRNQHRGLDIDSTALAHEVLHAAKYLRGKWFTSTCRLKP